MSENLSENSLDNMMLGDLSEGVSEQTSEEIAARAAAAAKKMQQLRKDEKHSKGFDDKLAKILSHLSLNLLDFVAFLIDKTIPSLTILALISIANDHAAKLCAQHFGAQNKKDSQEDELSIVGFENPVIASKIDLWWEFIFLADKDSKTLRLYELKTDQGFIDRVSVELANILRGFLDKNQVTAFNKSELERILNARGQQMFQA